MQKFTLLVCLFVISLLHNGLQSQSFDIYIKDLNKAKVFQATNIFPGDEYNVSFSNNGKKIACDVVVFDEFFNLISHDIYVTNLSTGQSQFLEGADGGNDASWSPNGKNIVFDRSPAGDPNIYLVPSEGGTRSLVVSNGISPDWSQDSERIVYQNWLNGSLRTVKKDGTDDKDLFFFGQNPNWSRNGKFIAFDIYFGAVQELFIIKVDPDGNPLSFPEQITFSEAGVYNSQCTWSNNSKNIAFHSNRETGENEIWSIELKTRKITKLAGKEGVADVDPQFSKNGQYIAFSSLTEELGEPLLTQGNIILEQIQPNPFQNSTFFRFEVEKRTYVQLAIFDTSGKLVTILQNGILDGGSHMVEWNPNNQAIAIPGGIYYAKITTESNLFTKPIIYTPAK